MISVNQQGQVIFQGPPSTALEREYLHERGFVHVSGLLVSLQGLAYHIGENLLPEDCGRWNTQGGLTAVTSANGEIWLRSGIYELSADDERQLTLRGRGGKVPLSGQNEIILSPRELLARFINPDAGLKWRE